MAVEFSYTNKDFESLKSEMLSKIPSLAEDWTNLNEGDLGMALINLLSGMGDMLSYYIDRSAEESFLPTAVTRDAVKRLSALIDYKLSRPVAARAVLVFTIPTPAETNIRIPAYTQCKTKDGYYFVTKEDATLYAGNSEVEVEAFQGQYVRDQFTSDGSSVQTFSLSRPNAAQNFLVTEVNGEQWTEDGPEMNYEESALYEVITDSSENASLRFSSYLGGVPSQNATITVTYLETAGPEGNVGAGKITELVSTIAGAPDITVNNPEMATGGRVRESADEARIAAPRRLRTLNRAVTLQDHVDIAEMFPGVAKAQAINHYGYVEMYVAPDGGELLYLPVPDFGAETPTMAESSLPAGNYDVVVTAIDENGGETAYWEYEHNVQDASDEDDDTRDLVNHIRTVNVPSGDAISAAVSPLEGAAEFALYVAPVGETPRLAYTAEAKEVGFTWLYAYDVPAADAKEVPEVNTTGARTEDGDGTIKNGLEAYMERRRLVGAIFAFYNPTYVPVDVTATVNVWENYKQSDVRGRVETALRELFDFDNREFGENLAVAEIYKTMMDVEGVRSVTNLTAPTGDTVTINKGEIATIGTTSLTMVGGIR